MSLADFKFGSGHRILAGQQGLLYDGRGEIWVAKPSIHGPDENLWGALKVGVEALRVKIMLSSIDTGQHVPNSRHYEGRAADVSMISSRDHVGWQPAVLANRAAVQFVNFYRQHGWRVGEGGNWPAFLMGPVGGAWNPSKVPHEHHIHLSIGRAYQPGVTERWDYYEPEPIDCERDDES